MQIIHNGNGSTLLKSCEVVSITDVVLYVTPVVLRIELEHAIAFSATIVSWLLLMGNKSNRRRRRRKRKEHTKDSVRFSHVYKDSRLFAAAATFLFH